MVPRDEERAEKGGMAHPEGSRQEYRGVRCVHAGLRTGAVGRGYDREPRGEPAVPVCGLSEMAEEAKWYVVHTYSGYENAVAAAVMKAAENRKMTDLIREVNIPMETVTEFTDNGEKTVERKVFPGYVLVKMILTDDSWHLIHNVRGATGFVGSDGKAIPLTEQEIYDLGVERREIVVGYAVGDEVKVIDGPLSGFLGTVDELEPEKNRVRVVVSMFGRETPVDLELDQVEVIKH